MENLELFQITGNEVQNLIRNFKKDSQSRKNNAGYFHQRIARLEDLARDFKDINSKLKEEDIPKDHNYFKTDYFNQILDLIEQYQIIFRQEIIKLADQADHDSAAYRGLSKTTTVQGASTMDVLATSSNNPMRDHPTTNGLVRRFAARMTSLERLINGIAEITLQQPSQYWQLKREAVQGLWKQLEELYDLIWDQFEDPTAVGADINKYIDLETTVHNVLVQLTVRAGQTVQENATPQFANALPLPKTHYTKV